jgi:hypothetical protein
MSDVLLAAIMVAFFLLAIGLVRVVSWLIDRDFDFEGRADEPPDTDETVNHWVHGGDGQLSLTQVSREAWSASLRPRPGGT